MNKNSKLSCFIADHEDWRDLLKNEYKIAIKEDYPYAIFNYEHNSNFSDPIVQEARGIIIDISTLDVACWPFRKFGNYTESYADPIDWKTARVQDKIDGSIVKLWWNKYTRQWQFSTNTTINAKDAIISKHTGQTYLDLIREADNYIFLQRQMSKLDQKTTYIFELVSPQTEIVIHYPTVHLYHIGTRNSVTGMEEIFDIGIEKPVEYPLKSLNDCMIAAEKLNQSKDHTIHSIKKEGFVVVDQYWHRIKIKSPDYIMLKKLSSGFSFSKERIIRMILNGSINIQDLSADHPDFAHYFKYYDFKIAELNYQAKVLCDLTDQFYEKTGHNRKAVANIVKNHRLAPIGFMHLSSGKSSDEILRGLELKQYCRYIPDYQPERISQVFYGGGDRSDWEKNEGKN